MTQIVRAYVCDGCDGCGWAGLEKSSTVEVTEFGVCPECDGMVHDGRIEIDEEELSQIEIRRRVENTELPRVEIRECKVINKAVELMREFEEEELEMLVEQLGLEESD